MEGNSSSTVAVRSRSNALSMTRRARVEGESLEGGSVTMKGF